MKKASLIVADSEKNADMLYATGFRAPDPFIYFAMGEKKGIIVSVLEYDRAITERKPDINVFRYEDFIKHGRRGMGNVLRILAASLKIKAFLVPGDFPLLLADYLRKHGLDVKPAASGFFPEREFKSETEILYLRDAQRITAEAMRRAENILREAKFDAKGGLAWQGLPLTSEILRAEINLELVRHGAFAASTIVAGGKQGAEPHNEGSGPLLAGSPIVIDIFPRVAATGYCGDMTRTFVKGKAQDIAQKAYDAVLKARESCKKMIKTGVNPISVHEHAVSILEKRGFKTGRQPDGRSYGFFHGLGHGLGLEVHEAPRMNLRNPEPFKGGEIVTVEPGVYYPEWGGIRLEDVVVVRSGRAECLTDYPNQLEIK